MNVFLHGVALVAMLLLSHFPFARTQSLRAASRQLDEQDELSGILNDLERSSQAMLQAVTTLIRLKESNETDPLRIEIAKDEITEKYLPNLLEFYDLSQGLTQLAEKVGAPPPENRRVFLTKTTHNGDMGGLRGADASCNSLAASAGLPGFYRAWLSTTEDSWEGIEAEGPADRYHLSHLADTNRPYVLADGHTLVADNWGDLTSGSSLLNPINQNEFGDRVDIYFGNDFMFSNTASDGSSRGRADCSGWTDSKEAVYRRGAEVTLTYFDDDDLKNLLTARQLDTSRSCSYGEHRLLCVGQ